jgi:predicted Zn-dependent protease
MSGNYCSKAGILRMPSRRSKPPCKKIPRRPTAWPWLPRTVRETVRQSAKALPMLDQSVAAEPGNYALHMMYGRGLRDAKKYDPAAQQFFQAAKLKPDSREAWNELAGMLYMLEKFPESLAALDRAHQLGDDTPGNYYFHDRELNKR